MNSTENDFRLREIQRQYLEFLDDEEDMGKYLDLVRNMIADKKSRLIVDINDLRHKNPERTQCLLNSSTEELLAFSRALKDFVFSLSPEFAKSKDVFHIGFKGSFGDKHVTPRMLSSELLGCLVCVEGLVNRCSPLRAKLVISVHYCPATEKFIERKYSDMLSLDPFPSCTVYPTHDEDGNELETEYGLSTYIESQLFSIQELPEKAPVGQLLQMIDVICENDLADECKPGDRVQVVGTYRCYAETQDELATGILNSVLVANNIIELSEETGPMLSGEDVSLMKSVAATYESNMFELLAKSLAPSIYGHDFVKKAILCQLLGGVEKILESGTRLRGDINILLIGDPSVAKSQLLRYVLNVAPRAIATTGRGSTGVGLTASITTDLDTGDKRLEAGAMVLADRGIVCIDEFDKMSDVNRTAIHEVMEQGSVTISKAGIHSKLNARSAVLAAANPVYGRYDPYKTPMDNIGLQDSLLSRFDLIFVLLDTVNEDNDSKIADHVLRMLRYREPNEQDGEIITASSNNDFLTMSDPKTNENVKKTQVFEKYNELLHGDLRDKNEQYFTVDFIKKYISMAKIIKPVLTDEANVVISEAYASLRSEDMLTSDVARTQPITGRSVETIIRLSEAVAKARMSTSVSVEDAKTAIKVFHFANFKKVLEKKKKRSRDSMNISSESTELVKRPNTRSQDNAMEIELTDDSVVNQSQLSVEEIDLNATVQLTAEKYKMFKSQLSDIFRTQRNDAYDLENLLTQVNKDKNFVRSELDEALKKLSDENQIMISENKVYCIG